MIVIIFIYFKFKKKLFFLIFYFLFVCLFVCLILLHQKKIISTLSLLLTLLKKIFPVSIWILVLLFNNSPHKSEVKYCKNYLLFLSISNWITWFMNVWFSQPLKNSNSKIILPSFNSSIIFSIFGSETSFFYIVFNWFVFKNFICFWK